MAHFLGPMPLSAPAHGRPSLLLPARPPRARDHASGGGGGGAGGAGDAAGPHHAASATPHLLLGERRARAAAAALAASGALAQVQAGAAEGAGAAGSSSELAEPLSLAAFMARHGVPRSRAHSAPLRPPHAPPALAASGGNASVAIVSLCAYDAAATPLAALSEANLRAYCGRHGYDCFAAQASLDASRPPAWSKLLLVAHFLPQYEWVLWRDCDSFFLDAVATVEDLVAAAAAARAAVADAVSGTIEREDEEEEANAADNDADAAAAAAAFPGDAEAAGRGAVMASLFGDGAHAPRRDNAHAAAPGGGRPSAGPDAAGLSLDAPVSEIFARARARVAERERELLGLPPAATPAPPGAPARAARAPAPAPPKRSASDSLRPPHPRTHSSSSSSSLRRAREPVRAAGSAPIDLIISEDGLMLNTGVWALRRSAWALGFLKRAYGVREGAGGGSGVVGGGGAGAAEAEAADAADAADAAAGASFPFSLTRVSGGGGEGLGGGGVARNATADAAATAVALRAMRAAPPGAENPLVRNRMWEQGGLLWQLAQGGAPIFAAEAGGDERSDACEEEEEAGEDDGVEGEGKAAEGAAIGGPALLPPLPACAAARRFRDLAHAQFVPQRWLNAYPPAIAAALRDHHGRPMHAAVARGDWVVSFSGCVGYFGQAECNRLFEAYAGEALGGGGAGDGAGR